ncbi:hypothetical protein FB45DRAFT_1027319 [Roridomyces roridus]|uniref:Uncharacterized protein n=1 Tax=Roridomyces roridus TaxID=1738132 RepID=A0AAD7BY06_9AGAR|nr:hypothetical protein FB45DRAFT_1027319 [Roridomyces roridus]
MAFASVSSGCFPNAEYAALRGRLYHKSAKALYIPTGFSHVVTTTKRGAVAEAPRRGIHNGIAFTRGFRWGLAFSRRQKTNDVFRLSLLLIIAASLNHPYTRVTVLSRRTISAAMTSRAPSHTHNGSPTPLTTPPPLKQRRTIEPQRHRNPYRLLPFEKSAQASSAPGVYLKTVIGGVVALSVVIFTLFSIHWGSIWSSLHHTLPVCIVTLTVGLSPKSGPKGYRHRLAVRGHNRIALQSIANLSTAANTATLLSSAPELVAQPIYYTVANLRPSDVPVAGAVTFVGLIYLVISSLFVVMLAATARQLIYTLPSRALQLPFDRRVGGAETGLLGMLVGVLALEAPSSRKAYENH